VATVSSLLLPFILATNIDFSSLDIPEPIQFVNQYFVENIQDDFIIYLSALAGVSILKSLMRF
jgi:hypothetical protein